MPKQNQVRNPKPRKIATKAEKTVRLLKRASGATITELQKATGWQAHSVRGFISGTVKKRMQLDVISEKAENGVRRYRIVEAADA